MRASFCLGLCVGLVAGPGCGHGTGGELQADLGAPSPDLTIHFPGNCSDGKKDDQETDVDCGGPDCPPCTDDRRCATASDCQSNGCSGGVCKPQSACDSPLANCDGSVLTGCNVHLDSDPANCGACGARCSSRAPLCVQGVCAAEVKLGYPSPFPQVAPAAPGLLSGFPITVARRATLLRFGLSADPPMAAVRFALYSDRDGRPDRLVHASRKPRLPGGVFEFDAAPGTTLAPGRYWLMSEFSSAALVGHEFEGTPLPSYSYALPFAAPVPAVFPAGPMFYVMAGNFWLVVVQ
jgi:hypothetical protein